MSIRSYLHLIAVIRSYSRLIAVRVFFDARPLDHRLSTKGVEIIWCQC